MNQLRMDSRGNPWAQVYPSFAGCVLVSPPRSGALSFEVHGSSAVAFPRSARHLRRTAAPPRLASIRRPQAEVHSS